MSFCPQKIILTSVEHDHQDYYPKYEDIRNAFVDYVMKLPENGDLIYCSDDKGTLEVVDIIKSKRNDINLIPYGQNADGDFQLKVCAVENEKNYFNIKLFGFEKADRLALTVPGHHEVLDAVAAVALVCAILRSYGKNPLDYKKNIEEGLIKFAGGKRRSEKIGTFETVNGDNVLVIDDYGHHPTAVKTTLDGFREFYKGRKIIIDFMSHTYSRTQALLKEFSESFDSADVIVLHKIYSSARENAADFNITGKTLYDAVCRHLDLQNKDSKSAVYYSEEILDAKQFVLNQLNTKLDQKKYPDGYLFVTMGAGDNWKLGKEILENR